MGLNAEETELYELMVNFHSFTQNQYICLRNMGGYGTLADLNQWRYKSIRKWCKNMGALAVNRGGRTFGDLKIKQLQGIAWWVTDSTLRNLPLDVNVYKADSDTYKLNAELDHLDQEHDDVTVDKPKKFQYKDWIEWEESVYMYFDSLKNLQNVPLSYVIRKDLPVGTLLTSLERKEQLIYNAPLNGFLYNKDNTTVGNIIRECCLGTEAESWIANIRGGRQAMIALRTHYDGPDEARKRLSSAKAKLDKLFYRNEATFSFEKFITSLNNIYNVHVRYNEPIYETDKIRYLLDKCQNNHQEFRQTVVLCRAQHTTFAGAVTMLKESVGRLFPDVHRRGKRTIADINSHRGKGKGKMKKEYNGVDVSDLSRWYDRDELKKLPKWLQKKICTNKDHQNKNKEKISKIKRAKVNAVDTADGNDDNTANTSNSSTALSNADERVVAAVINGLHRASQSTASIRPITFPHSGRNATIAATQRTTRGNQAQDDASTLTFDHNGDVV